MKTNKIDTLFGHEKWGYPYIWIHVNLFINYHLIENWPAMLACITPSPPLNYCPLIPRIKIKLTFAHHNHGKVANISLIALSQKHNSSLLWTMIVLVLVSQLFLNERMVWLGWELNILESVVVSLSIGLSVDFTLHYAIMYKLATETDRYVQYLCTIICNLVLASHINWQVCTVFMYYNMQSCTS